MTVDNPRVLDRVRMDIYPDLSRTIIGAAYEVHNELGRGFLEKVYENALAQELRAQGLDVEAQAPIPVEYKGESIGLYYADLFVDGKIIVEVKTVETLSVVHESQLLHYLKATGVQLGLLLNFATDRVQIRRRARTK